MALMLVISSVQWRGLRRRGMAIVESVARSAHRHLSPRSAGGSFAMVAAVLDEPEDADALVDGDGVQRDLRRQERAALGSAGELDGRRAAVPRNLAEQRAQL